MTEIEGTTGIEDPGSTPDPTPDPGSTPGAPDGTGTTPEEAAPGSTPATPAEGADEPPEWRNFLAKFNKDGKTDYAEAAKSYWETTRGAAAQARENEALRARLAEMERAPKTPPPPPTPPPQLQKLEQRIQAFTAERESLTAERNAIVPKVGQADRQIGILEYRLSVADPMDKPGLEAQLDYQRGLKAQLVADYQRTGRDLARLDTHLEDLSDRRESVEREIEAEKERQEQAEAARAEFMESFPRQVDGYIEQAAQELKLGIPAGEGSFAWKAVNAMVMADCWRASGQPSGTLDFPALVRAHIQELQEALKAAGASALAVKTTETLKVKKPLMPAAPARAATPSPGEPRKPSWQDPANSDWRDLPQYVAAREGRR